MVVIEYETILVSAVTAFFVIMTMKAYENWKFSQKMDRFCNYGFKLLNIGAFVSQSVINHDLVREISRNNNELSCGINQAKIDYKKLMEFFKVVSQVEPQQNDQ